MRLTPKRPSVTLYRTLILMMTATWMTGCGAPTKSSSEVKSSLEEAKTLDQKLSSLCAALAGRDDALLTETTEARCQNAGVAASNLGLGEPMKFQGTYSESKTEGDVLTLETRGQGWMNASLLGLSAKLLNKFTADESGLFSGSISGDALTLDTSTLGDLATVDVNFIQDPSFDMEKLQFSTSLSVKISGILTVDADFEFGGGIVDRRIVAVGKTTRASDQSMLKAVNFSVFIIPHASDIYLDSFTNIQIVNIGLASLLQEQVDRIMETIFYNIYNELLELGGGPEPEGEAGEEGSEDESETDEEEA